MRSRGRSGGRGKSNHGGGAIGSVGELSRRTSPGNADHLQVRQPPQGANRLTVTHQCPAGGALQQRGSPGDPQLRCPLIGGLRHPGDRAGAGDGRQRRPGPHPADHRPDHRPDADRGHQLPADDQGLPPRRRLLPGLAGQPRQDPRPGGGRLPLDRLRAHRGRERGRRHRCPHLLFPRPRHLPRSPLPGGGAAGDGGQPAGRELQRQAAQLPHLSVHGGGGGDAGGRGRQIPRRQPAHHWP